MAYARCMARATRHMPARQLAGVDLLWGRFASGAESAYAALRRPRGRDYFFGSATLQLL
jgi:hypothetical protein